MSDKSKDFLTFKSGKFSFIHNYSAKNIEILITTVLLLNETIIDLPILPDLVSILELDLNYRSIAGTAAIENNPLTEEDVKKIAEGQPVEGYSQRHKQEIMNLIEVYKILDRFKIEKKPVKITEEFIKVIHKDITKNVDHEYNIPGNYRNNEVFVGDKSHGGIYKPPKILKDIQNLMAEFVGWINSEEIVALNPFIRAALAHYHLCLIHPFADGNGRTARFLEAIILKSVGIKYTLKDLSNYYYRNIDDYYTAFSKSIKLKKQNDISPFIEFMLTGAVNSLKDAKSKIVNAIRLLSLNEYFRVIFEKRKITKRQYSFLKILLGYKNSFSLNDLYNTPAFETLYGKVTKQTARRDMKNFQTLGIIKKNEKGKFFLHWKQLG